MKKSLTDRQIAVQPGFSIFTVRNWRRKFAVEEKEGLISRLMRPKIGI